MIIFIPMVMSMLSLMDIYFPTSPIPSPTNCHPHSLPLWCSFYSRSPLCVVVHLVFMKAPVSLPSPPSLLLAVACSLPLLNCEGSQWPLSPLLISLFAVLCNVALQSLIMWGSSASEALTFELPCPPNVFISISNDS